MSTPSHPEDAPLNDTNDAKGLRPDPQLEEVERRQDDARDLGLSQDEAQARAWSGVNGGAPRAKDGPGHEGPPPGDISVGG